MSVKISNPLFLSDFPDPCVICVDNAYYMTSTSMYFMPGIPIMRSYNLADWEIVSYVYDTFLNNPAHNLTDGQNIYGKGSWATSLRYNDGWFYVCFNCNDAQNTFIYRTQDIINGIWEHSVIPGSHHDPSLLFDDDGTYLVYGCGTIYILELERDTMGVKTGGVDQILVNTPKVSGLNCEGSHFHKIDGKYYLMLIQWPKGSRRIQWCYRCDSLLGDYEGKIVLDDDMGYKNCGVAQGGLFRAINGDWYAMLFQDRLPYGRCPVLVPVAWSDGWPVLGVNRRVQESFAVSGETCSVAPFIDNDEFNYSECKLPHIWQWNHNPDNSSWTVTERYGWLRLYNNAKTSCFEQARNMLTQHTIGPECSFWTLLDASGMKSGDSAGLAALHYLNGRIGVTIRDGNSKSLTIHIGKDSADLLIDEVPLESDVVFLKIHFAFESGGDTAKFYYSYDGSAWRMLGEPLHMEYFLEHFTGYRPALYSYSESETGGYADFDFLRFSNDAL